MSLKIWIANTLVGEHEFTVPLPAHPPRAGEVVEIAPGVDCAVEEVQWDLDFNPTLIFRNIFDAKEWAAITARMNAATVADTDADIIDARCQQRDTLAGALHYIAELGGNLPDESLTSRSGPNDAVSRGLKYTEARRAALAALEAV